MDIKIDGNPGTGNTFQQININGPVQNLVPNATQVVNNYYGTSKRGRDAEPVVDKAAVRKKILEDVGKLLDMLYKPKQAIWMSLWSGILELPEVRHDVYDRGNNHDTIYSRKLVAAIIHFIGGEEKNCLNWFTRYNASAITRALGYPEGASIRGELGSNPSVGVMEAVRRLITENYGQYQ